MLSHGVKIVSDDCWPEDVDFAFARKTDGTMVLVMPRSASGNQRALAEAWATYRALTDATALV